MKPSVLLLCLALATARGATPGGAGAFRKVSLAGRVPWSEILARARAEGEVRWFHWGGSDELNYWIETTAKPELAELGVGLVTSRAPDTRDAVDQIFADAAPRGPGEGAVDAVWLNGENFYTLAVQDLLFGPFADKLPNSRFFYLCADDPRARVNRLDNGYPTELREVPWAGFQYTCMIDTARFSREAAPHTFGDLERFLRLNPGRFTYVRPPRLHRQHLCAERALRLRPGGDGRGALFAGWRGRKGARKPDYPETQAPNEFFSSTAKLTCSASWGSLRRRCASQAGFSLNRSRTFSFPRAA